MNYIKLISIIFVCALVGCSNEAADKEATDADIFVSTKTPEQIAKMLVENPDKALAASIDSAYRAKGDSTSMAIVMREMKRIENSMSIKDRAALYVRSFTPDEIAKAVRLPEDTAFVEAVKSAYGNDSKSRDEFVNCLNNK